MSNPEAISEVAEKEKASAARTVNGMVGHLLLRNAQLQQRVKTFQEGYRDKSFEVTALEIQILDIKATGYDARLERNFEKMKRECLVAIEERNEARAANALFEEVVEALKVLLGHLPVFPKTDDPRSHITTDDLGLLTVGQINKARAALAKVEETKK